MIMRTAKASPAPPGRDLHIRLPVKPKHPRQRRGSNSSQYRMCELEIHSLRHLLIVIAPSICG